MADPTIQTFCCHNGANNTSAAVKMMNEFNSESYNILCLTSSLIGIGGALYQICPREEFSVRARMSRISSLRGRQIIIWLAMADLLASIGVFVRSAVWLNFTNLMPIRDESADVIFCALTSAWTQYFYTATWFWTLFYAIDTHLLLRDKHGYSSVYHTLAWGLPAVLTGSGLGILYYPEADCHTMTTLTGALYRILPNYCATYIPITLVMIANPIVYFLTSKNIENAVSQPLSQITNKERCLIDGLKLKFGLINIVFYLCWLPNIINGILIWTLWFNLPVKVMIVIWYLMAVMNPLQALFNALVYRRWTPGAQRLKFPFSNKIGNNKRNEPTVRTPLLRDTPSRLHLTDRHQNSINAFSSL